MALLHCRAAKAREPQNPVFAEPESPLKSSLAWIQSHQIPLNCYIVSENKKRLLSQAAPGSPTVAQPHFPI